MPASRTVLWFRRDLRLSDHGALLAAAASAEVLPLFVLDPTLLEPAAGPRAAWLLSSVQALAADLATHGGSLVVRVGDPVEVVPAVVAEIGASSVQISSDFAPYGRRRDAAVREALAALPHSPALIESDSPYAVVPGAVRTGEGGAFQVFTPFFRAWSAHGWPPPAPSDPAAVTWIDAPSTSLPAVAAPITLPPAGEAAAHAAWDSFAQRRADYPTTRDRPDLDATSRLSAYLKVGAIHPRTLLGGLDLVGPGGASDEVFIKELAWREFYAAVLSRWPTSATTYFRPQLAGLTYADGAELAESLEAWALGMTGFPFVDAGMRQLLSEGWMHNRVRMVVASFLVKDLRVEWTHGARHFMAHLIDGDLASNAHGWQWAAGCGTDAAPYFRIFNPITQGQKFDPAGAYIARWIPELRDLEPKFRHQPWLLPDGPPAGYPPPIVDHAEARRAALADYEALRSRTR